MKRSLKYVLLCLPLACLYLFYRFLWAWSGFDNAPYGRVDQRMFASHRVAEEKMRPYRTSPILTDGLYVDGLLLLPPVIEKLFTERSVHFLEINEATARRLLRDASNADMLSQGMRVGAIIRLSLGDDQDTSCFQFKDEKKDWTRWNPPIRPGTCLKVEFDNTVRSKLAIRLRDVRYNGLEVLWDRLRFDVKPDVTWQLVDRRTGSEIVALSSSGIQTQNGAYASDGVLGILLSGLSVSPELIPRVDQHVLRRIYFDEPSGGQQGEAKVIPAEVAEVAGEAPAAPPEYEAWLGGYVRAYTANAPTIVARSIVIFPNDNTFAYLSRNSTPPPRFVVEKAIYRLASVNDSFDVQVLGYDFHRQVFWKFIASATPLPASMLSCKFEQSQCRFIPVDMRITDTHLIIAGNFVRYDIKVPASMQHHEISIPLAQLPPIPNT